jgi:hypothetical protein
MRFVPSILLVLSLPAGLLGYALAVWVIKAVAPEQANGVLILFVPLLVAGLCMLPFLVPFFDRKAKADLAAYRRDQEASAKGGGDKPAT